MSTVSIAIATWNGSRHLEEQLRSILAQTRLPDQIVLRDDRSDDGTVGIASDVLAGAPFQVDIGVNQRRLGSTGNFEAALSACTGDIVLFCDQDDVWDPGKIQRLAGVLDSRPEVGWVFCDARLADASMRVIGPSFWRHEGFGPERQSRFLNGRACEEMLSRSMVMGASMAFRRSLAAELLPIGPGWVHDEWIALALATRGARGDLVPEALQSYRTHTSQQIGISRGARPSRNARIDIIGHELARLDTFIATFPNSATLVAAKRRHMAARCRILQSTAFVRLALVMREWIRGGYRFSYSWRAVVRDALGL